MHNGKIKGDKINKEESQMWGVYVSHVNVMNARLPQKMWCMLMVIMDKRKRRKKIKM
jgi:hypothetical protein